LGAFTAASDDVTVKAVASTTWNSDCKKWRAPQTSHGTITVIHHSPVAERQTITTAKFGTPQLP
jgi:hypothetical protein